MISRKLSIHIRFLMLILLFCLSIGNSMAQTRWKYQDESGRSIYRYPMRIPPEISGSFAELRNTHFHGGLDFRTQQREGIKVYSVAPGIIYRASVSHQSYGMALYIQHPDSSVTLYAHLSRFTPAVRRKIRKEQRRTGQYEVNLTGLKVKSRKNRPIAYSGNTGSSGGPHLHFEIIKDGKRLNPCLHGHYIADSAAPNTLFFSVYVPQDSLLYHDTVLPTEKVFDLDSLYQSSIIGSAQIDQEMYNALKAEHDSLAQLFPKRIRRLSQLTPWKQIDHIGTNGKDVMQDKEADWTGLYYRTTELPDTLFLHSPVSFGLCSTDSIHRMPFRYGLYRLLFAIYKHDSLDTSFKASDNTEFLFRSGIKKFEKGKTQDLTLPTTPWVKAADTLAFYQLDALPLETCRAIRQHIDMAFFQETRYRLETSRVYGNPGLSPYRILRNNGIFYPEEGKKYTLFIRAEDLQGNMTEIRIPMIGQ